ncbi:MAG: hypothetical protein LBV30_09055 [Propionibacteriaceae bacterium]|jgi:hypothetical protein|nr:hypothetical protein [Propionibacteriaceae bacterium]
MNKPQTPAIAAIKADFQAHKVAPTIGRRLAVGGLVAGLIFAPSVTCLTPISQADPSSDMPIATATTTTADPGGSGPSQADQAPAATDSSSPLSSQAIPAGEPSQAGAATAPVVSAVPEEPTPDSPEPALPGVTTAVDPTTVVISQSVVAPAQIDPTSSAAIPSAGSSLGGSEAAINLPMPLDANSDRQAAVDQARQELRNKQAVSYETATQAASAQLEAMLNDQSKTAADIRQATADLLVIVAADMAARNAAIAIAQAAIDQAKDYNSSGPTDWVVFKYMGDLIAIIDRAGTGSPNGRTADIIAATNDLLKSLPQVDDALDAAKEAARSALGSTSPVSHEPGVSALVDQVNRLLSDPNIGADQLQSQTGQLLEAVEQALAARGQAEDLADQAVDALASSPLLADPGLQAALDALAEVRGRADADQLDGLTADILAALDDLRAAELAAQAAQDALDAAKEAARSALGSTSPVSHESPLDQAIADLEGLLADTESTADELLAGTEVVADLLAPALVDRERAVGEANQLADLVTGGVLVGEPGVADALDDLNDVLAWAGDDQPDALTADIDQARQALEEAAQAAGEAREAGQLAVDGVRQPVSYEPTVRAALDSLIEILADPNSSNEQIDSARLILDGLTAPTRDERALAVSAANAVIERISAGELSTEPALRTAIDSLSQVMATAATDTPEALTQDILDALAMLSDIEPEVQVSRDQAEDAADQAVVDATDPAVSDDQGVLEALDQLAKVIADPSHTTADINQATDQVNQAVTDAKQAAVPPDPTDPDPTDPDPTDPDPTDPDPTDPDPTDPTVPDTDAGATPTDPADGSDTTLSDTTAADATASDQADGVPTATDGLATPLTNGLTGGLADALISDLGANFLTDPNQEQTGEDLTIPDLANNQARGFLPSGQSQIGASVPFSGQVVSSWSWLWVVSLALIAAAVAAWLRWRRGDEPTSQ